jgi:hypothetical protein
MDKILDERSEPLRGTRIPNQRQLLEINSRLSMQTVMLLLALQRTESTLLLQQKDIHTIDYLLSSSSLLGREILLV